MISSFFKKIFILFLFPVIAYAIPVWKIIPNQSSLSFSGTQNGAPASGKFEHFSGDIKFDPEDLNESSVRIVVDTTSVSASYEDLVATLKTTDWFNVKLFPEATFSANQFKKTGDKKYEAIGNLTIRDKTHPVTIQFEVLELNDTSAKVKGSTIIKRTAFGIGQGEWSSTKEVKDDVTVNFILSVMKQ